MKLAMTFEAQVIFLGELGETINVENILNQLAHNELKVSYINPKETIGNKFVIYLNRK